MRQKLEPLPAHLQMVPIKKGLGHKSERDEFSFCCKSRAGKKSGKLIDFWTF